VSAGAIERNSIALTLCCQIDGQGLYKINGGGKVQCFSISGAGGGIVTFIGLTITNGKVITNVSGIVQSTAVSLSLL
jgi:hypothetical protein